MEKSCTLIVGAIGAQVFNFFYGGNKMASGLMIALVFFIVMDWITGVRAAKNGRTYASKYGIDGVFRTFFILLLPAGGHLLDEAFGFPDIIFGALAVGVLYHTLQSMTANAVRAGWTDWFPQKVLDWIIKWVESELDKKVERSMLRGGSAGSEGVKND